jgi:hypothetical protein
MVAYITMENYPNSKEAFHERRNRDLPIPEELTK